MSKFTCLVLCAVAVSLSSVHADDGNGSCREDFKPLEQECLKKQGLTEADMNAALNAGDATLIDSCFWGCYFKTLGLLNDKGQFDLNTGLTNIKKYVTNDLRKAKLEETAKVCEKVKDNAVSDGEAGCEMGALVADCFLKRTLSEKTK